MNLLEIINLENSAENFIGDQLSYLREKGQFQVSLVCSPSERLEPFAKSQGVAFQAIYMDRQVNVLQDIKAFFQICRFIRKNKIDIIVCHQAKARTLAIPAAWLMRVRHRIIFAHGVLHETMRGLKRWLVCLNDRILGAMSTNVICVSRHVMAARVRDRIDKPEKQVIIGNGSCNGIEVVNRFNPMKVSAQDRAELREKLGFSSDCFVIGFCGRLVKDKGVEELSESFAELKRRHPEKELKLLVIGKPEQRDAVPEDVLKNLYDSQDVVFTGQVAYDDMPKYYAVMDVFLFPSHRDGLGLAPLEAQAMEVPALVTSITGCKETIVEGKTGFYIELDKEPICEKIKLFFDDALRRKFGQDGRRFVCECFDHEVFKQQILAFLKSLE